MENHKQKYEEALERAKKYYNRELYAECNGSLVEDIFPELKKNEDEEIRNEIIQSIQDNMCVIHKDKCIAWLEKQGEKPNVWSEDDDDNMIMIEDRLSDYLDYIRKDSTLTKHQKYFLKENVIGYVNWLKSIKDRMKGE